MAPNFSVAIQTSRRAVGGISRERLAFIRGGHCDHAHTDLLDAAVGVTNATGCTADASATDPSRAAVAARARPSAAGARSGAAGAPRAGAADAGSCPDTRDAGPNRSANAS
jgi:hypothetical protein